jgi:methylmalonyl-CoA mutase cobalamin-binding domain/chain
MAVRVLVAKGGLDGHDRGIKLLATALRSAGMEVVFLGAFQTTERVVRSAIDEDVHIVGLSCHAGEHVSWTKEVRQALDAAGGSDIHIVVGGVFPAHDLDDMRAAGAELVFRVGETLQASVERLRDLAAHPIAAGSDGSVEVGA